MLNKEKARKFIPIVSGAFFVAMTISSLAGMFAGNSGKPSETSRETPPIEQQIAAQKKGYQIVLEREPNNEIALRGLVEIAIQTNQLSEAIAPLEKLVELNPGRPEYTALLNEVKTRATPIKPHNQQK
jgi:cytochrome c-type biogenesis protein CcmH/NrfG